MARVLLVEDEVHLAEGIRENLEAEGYAVELASDGELALARWQRGGLDLIVLDVMLPRLDGFSVCKAIRAAGDRLPILFLTAKSGTDDRILGLELGGDDYLGKPFHLRELLARVRGMLRRQAWYEDAAPRGKTHRIGRYRVDFTTYDVIGADGPVDVLSQKEVMILKLLVERPGEVVSRETILDRVWGYDVYPSTRTIDNFIVRLRKRFEVDPADPQMLQTVRGVGYRYVPSAARDPQS